MISLRPKATIALTPAAPFNFDATVHKPSHLPAPISAYEPGTYWRAMRLAGHIVGIRMRDAERRGLPRVEVTVYARGALSRAVLDNLAFELRWRFALDTNLVEFNRLFADDRLLGPVISRREGMRPGSGHSLYDYMVIAIMLQNTNVRRTVSMFEALMVNYGTRVSFDGREMYAMFEPAALTRASEQDLRGLRLGYRAKSLKRITAQFVSGEVDELAMRAMDREVLRRELLKLYGVGPQSAWYMMFELFHHYDAFDVISPWEQKIFSRLLFDAELAPADDILDEVKRRWGRWRMLAAHYLFEDLFWRHRVRAVPWLTPLIAL